MGARPFVRGAGESLSGQVVAIGGGLAGAAVATLLARAGRDVVLLERERVAQHKVCGEFLSGEALSSLAALGIDVAALGAVPIETVRFGGGDAVPLPFPAMSLTRRALDEALLEVAESAGARVIRGVTVRGLILNGHMHRLQLSTGSEMTADTCFLASGKHDVRGWLRPPGEQRNLLAMKMYFRLSPAQTSALRGRVELILYRGGYAGLQPVEDGAANLCCLIDHWELRRSSLRGEGRGWSGLLERMLKGSALLRERLEGATALLPTALSVASIPYGMLREPQPGLWCVGDQAAVIPSFTGDGMSIALHTAEVAAAMYLAGATAEEYQERIAGELRAQVRLATVVSKQMVANPGLLRAAAWLWPGALRAVATRTRVGA